MKPRYSINSALVELDKIDPIIISCIRQQMENEKDFNPISYIMLYDIEGLLNNLGIDQPKTIESIKKMKDWIKENILTIE